MNKVLSCLDAASHAQDVLVIGYDEFGHFFASSSTGDTKELLYLVEQFRAHVMDGRYAD